MSRAASFCGPATDELSAVANPYDLLDVMDEENQEWLPLNAADEASPAFESDECGERPARAR